MTTFPICVELEIDGTWVDVSERARHVPPTIHRGRPDELSTVAPTSTSVVFDNTDGYLTPRNPESPWYPHITRGLPCRICVEAGDPYLLLSGAANGRATTPDNAALDITGDLFIAVEFQAPIHIPASGTRHELIGKWTIAGDQRSYYLTLDQFGRLALFWSTSGALGGVPAALVSTNTVPFRTAGLISVAVSLDVNFAGSHVGVFWAIHGTLSELVAAIVADPDANQIGFEIGSGTTSIFNSTAALQIGDVSTSDVAYQGGIRRAQVRSGDYTGTIVANPDFVAQTAGAASFTDSAGRVWSLNGDALITNRQLRLHGQVDAIELAWPKATRRDSSDDGVATATMTVSGDLRRMQQGDKPVHSSIYRLVSSRSVADDVHAYWPLEEGRDAKTFASPIENVKAGTLAGSSPSSDSTLDASEALPTVASGDFFRWKFVVPKTITVNTNWQSTMFVNIPEAPASELQMMVVDTSANFAHTWALSISNTIVRIRIIDNDGTEVGNATISSDTRMFGGWMLVDLNATQSGGNVNWSYNLTPLTLEAPFGSSGSFAGSAGRPTTLRGGTTAPTEWSFGHFIVTTNKTLGWLAGADSAWVEETAAHRVWRLCNEEQIPVTVVGDNTVTEYFRGNPELSERMGPQRPLSLLALLQECADADRGILYDQRGQSGLAFRTHKSMQNQTAAATFNVDLDGLAPPFAPIHDDARFRNDITASREAGSSYRLTTDPAPSANETYDEEITVNIESDLRLGNHAGWRLHQATWPELRIPTVSSSMLKAGTGVTAQWANMDLGDRFDATNLMRQYDQTTTQLLESYDETLSLFNWTAEIVGSPAGPWEVGVRDDDTRGKRDTAGSALSAGLTATAIAFAVGPVANTDWTQSAGDFPFDVDIGGEQITVGAFVNFAGVYVFDQCTRSVNGVVKAHDVGAEVRLWRPTVRAL